MRFEVHTPLFQKEVATCIISGPWCDGYIKVKVNGAYAKVGPDLYPDDDEERRSLQIVPGGGGYDVWTKPLWKAGDVLVFELYDEEDTLLEVSAQIPVLP